MRGPRGYTTFEQILTQFCALAQSATPRPYYRLKPLARAWRG